jgi:long-chain acyl-CoA synthetase
MSAERASSDLTTTNAAAVRPGLAGAGGASTILEAFRHHVRNDGDAPAIAFFDRQISYAELDRDSDAMAVWLADHQIGAGDRVCVIMQNVPQVAIILLAAWKRGAVIMPCNPMYTASELTKLIHDAMPSAVFCEARDEAKVSAALAGLSRDCQLLTIDPCEYQRRDDGRVLPARLPGRSQFLDELCRRRGSQAQQIEITLKDAALLLYTSGSTGQPKGVVHTHASLAANTGVCQRWFDLGPKSVLLTIAPMFHITGLVCNLFPGISSGSLTVIGYRFHPEVVLDLIREYRPTFTIGAITAFTALMNSPEMKRDDFRSFNLVYSGGAPIPAAVRARFEALFGLPLYLSYGMTEAAAPTHLCPRDVDPPYDPVSDTLSVGRPVDHTEARVVDEQGHDLPPGEPGELLVRGPQVMQGYWQRPDDTAQALEAGWLHTGDVAVIDAEGWCYIVDRKKEMICASGFKIWPREVEDTLYSLPAVLEVAIVGKPDSYRGETVKAYISVRPGMAITADEVSSFAREKLAAYKCPREIEFLEELPKTATGKLSRTILRDRAAQETSV